MTKFVDSLGLKRLVTKIAEAVGNGTWLPVSKDNGEGSVVIGTGAANGESSVSIISGRAMGNYSYAEGIGQAEGNSSHAEGSSTAQGDGSHAEGDNCIAEGVNSHVEGEGANAAGDISHAEGQNTEAMGWASHAEGGGTQVSGAYSHAQGAYNYNDASFIDMVGIGKYSPDNNHIRKNASVVYVKLDEQNDIDLTDPKNGYQYLLGVGGYQGRNIAEGMKSVQEVIADLEKGVAASETMTVEEIREIMSA